MWTLFTARTAYHFLPSTAILSMQNNVPMHEMWRLSSPDNLTLIRVHGNVRLNCTEMCLLLELSRYYQQFRSEIYLTSFHGSYLGRPCLCHMLIVTRVSFIDGQQKSSTKSTTQPTRARIFTNSRVEGGWAETRWRPTRVRSPGSLSSTMTTWKS